MVIIRNSLSMSEKGEVKIIPKITKDILLSCENDKVYTYTVDTLDPYDILSKIYEYIDPLILKYYSTMIRTNKMTYKTVINNIDVLIEKYDLDNKEKCRNFVLLMILTKLDEKEYNLALLRFVLDISYEDTINIMEYDTEDEHPEAVYYEAYNKLTDKLSTIFDGLFNDSNEDCDEEEEEDISSLGEVDEPPYEWFAE